MVQVKNAIDLLYHRSRCDMERILGSKILILSPNMKASRPPLKEIGPYPT